MATKSKKKEKSTWLQLFLPSKADETFPKPQERFLHEQTHKIASETH